MAHSLLLPSSARFFTLLFLLWVLLADFVCCVRHCLSTKVLCENDPSCSLLLRIVSENCGRNYESACAAHDLLTCKTSLKAIQLHKIFENSCICTDENSDVQCHHFYAYIFKNPCLEIIDTGSQFDEQTPSCNYAFKICSANAKCKRVFELFQKACKVQNDECRMPIRSRCEQYINKLQMTPLYGCHCHTIDEKCDRIHQLVHGNPCFDVLQIQPYFDNHNPWERSRKTSSSILPSNSRTKSGIVSVFANPSENSEALLPPPTLSFQPLNPTEPAPPNPSGSNTMEQQQERRTQILLPPISPQDAAQIPKGSTCSWAKDACEADTPCHLLLEDVHLACDENGVTCNQSKCMTAIKNFYLLGNPDKTFDIAFCNCRPDDDACLVSQRHLHPPCAFNIHSHMPGCDDIAETCLTADPDCKNRLQRFVQACAVDRETFRCKGSSRSCQEARVAILGTPLRNSCGCSGNNILSLYKCTDWQRTVWMNPCVVQAQREYLENRMNSVPLPPRLETKLGPPNFTLQPTAAVYIQAPTLRSTTKATTTTTSTTSTSVPPTTSTQYCILPRKDSIDLMIQFGSGRRVYHRDEPDCSSICMCDIKGELLCKVLPCDERLPCQTSFAVYSHASPAYQAYRGRCICYSGNFICVKPSPQLYTLRQGVFLFLGYSELEERLLSPYTQLNILNSVKRIQVIMEENKEDNGGCKLQLYKHIGENIVMQAYLEEFIIERENNSITENMVIKEKELCYPLLKNLTDRINANDPHVKKDISMSLFKLAEVEVHVKEPSGANPTKLLDTYLSCVIAILLGLYITVPMTSL